MEDKTFLMIPGPTPVPNSVLLSMAKEPIGHRSSEFSAVLKSVYEDLKWAFQTTNDVFIYTSSGTGAMEGALSNLINYGDKVLSLSIGNFGQRWAKIAKMLGAQVETLQVSPGKAINPYELECILKDDINNEIKLVTLTHNETSTGVTNDVKALCEVIKKNSSALSVVDGVTSIGAMPCKMDEWGIDVLVSGSQKGFMVPPGLSFLSASEKAFEVAKMCKRPSFYFNWEAYKKSCAQNSTPYTPNVNLIVALKKALELMKKDGLENIQRRHKKHALALREAIKAMGLELFVKDEKIASTAITAILPPKNITVPAIRKTLKEDFDIVVANGQNELKDKIFRIGTLGFVCDRDVLASIGCLEATLAKLGYKFEVGSATKVAIEVLINN